MYSILKRKDPFYPNFNTMLSLLIKVFFLYILFFLSDLLLKYLRENKNDFAICLFISKLIFFHCLVPYMIIRNLRLTMPLLFSKNKIEKVNFHISGWSITPRHQVLLPLKQFTSKARWGSTKKFQFLLPNQPGKIHSKNCVPAVEC